MSEKRFKKMDTIIDPFPIWDTVEEKGYNCTDTLDVLVDLLNEQQATINELQSIINHIKCEENCFDYDYCCETVCSLYNEIKHLKEENEQLQKENIELKKLRKYCAEWMGVKEENLYDVVR